MFRPNGINNLVGGFSPTRLLTAGRRISTGTFFYNDGAKKLYVEKMTAAQVAGLEPVLRPHAASVKGFLGYNESLVESARKKAGVLKRNGVTFEQLAEKIDTIESVPETHDVRVLRAKGYQFCPFPECNAHSNADLTITQKATNKQVNVPGLMPHLIEDHHFLEGYDTPYGLDPQEAVDVLELKKQST